MKLFSNENVINRVILAPVDHIRPNPDQPRRIFDPAAIEELANSIVQNGLLQPITIREADKGSYELIAGERRLIACRQLGWDKIPAIVSNVAPMSSAVLALVENLHRTDLNYFEVAQGIQNLISRMNLSQVQVAQLLGKSQPAVANKLRLLRLPQEVRNYLLSEGLTERHARALLKLTNSDMMLRAASYIAEHSLNVEKSEAYINTLVDPREKSKSGKGVVRDVRILFNTISKAVKTVKDAGLGVETIQTEDDNFINYLVRVPKASQQKPKPAAKEDQAFRALADRIQVQKDSPQGEAG